MKKFFIFKKVWILENKVRFLENKNEPEYVECFTCGCLLNKFNVFRGESKTMRGIPITTIDGQTIYRKIMEDSLWNGSKTEQFLEDRYYCKIHKKNKKEYGK